MVAHLNPQKAYSYLTCHDSCTNKEKIEPPSWIWWGGTRRRLLQLHQRTEFGPLSNRFGASSFTPGSLYCDATKENVTKKSRTWLCYTWFFLMLWCVPTKQSIKEMRYESWLKTVFTLIREQLSQPRRGTPFKFLMWNKYSMSRLSTYCGMNFSIWLFMISHLFEIVAEFITYDLTTIVFVFTFYIFFW